MPKQKDRVATQRSEARIYCFSGRIPAQIGYSQRLLSKRFCNLRKSYHVKSVNSCVKLHWEHQYVVLESLLSRGVFLLMLMFLCWPHPRYYRLICQHYILFERQDLELLALKLRM